MRLGPPLLRSPPSSYSNLVVEFSALLYDPTPGAADPSAEHPFKFASGIRADAAVCARNCEGVSVAVLETKHKEARKSGRYARLHPMWMLRVRR